MAGTEEVVVVEDEALVAHVETVVHEAETDAVAAAEVLVVHAEMVVHEVVEAEMVVVHQVLISQQADLFHKTKAEADLEDNIVLNFFIGFTP